jgi:hypothetical protein
MPWTVVAALTIGTAITATWPWVLVVLMFLSGATGGGVPIAMMCLVVGAFVLNLVGMVGYFRAWELVRIAAVIQALLLFFIGFHLASFVPNAGVWMMLPSGGHVLLLLVGPSHRWFRGRTRVTMPWTMVIATILVVGTLVWRMFVQHPVIWFLAGLTPGETTPEPWYAVVFSVMGPIANLLVLVGLARRWKGLRWFALGHLVLTVSAVVIAPGPWGWWLVLPVLAATVLLWLPRTAREPGIESVDESVAEAEVGA